MAMAAPAAASAGRAAAGKAAGKKAAKKTGKKAAAPALSKGRGDLPQRGDWRQRAQEVSDAGGGGGGAKGKGKPSRTFKGEVGKYRRMMIAEFIVCVMLLGLSPLAKPPGSMGPIRFMKRGSATCAFFIILGLLSTAGKGAAKAAATFGALVTLVLLVDQREAFGKLAVTLNSSKDDDAKDAASFNDTVGPDDSTALPDEPGVAQV